MKHPTMLHEATFSLDREMTKANKTGISESGEEEAQGERVSGESFAERLASIFGTEKDRVNCPFYFKIRACRHGDRCSRLHTKPSISRTLLLSNMYRRPDMITLGVNALGNPIDPREIQQYFEDLYEELSKYGEIESLKSVTILLSTWASDYCGFLHRDRLL
ncbi:splicing factor U2af small subunit A-like [Populus nigra]|uniref:splicing factor U2af small subunit A-like n=1 Tax=Populus nigra TaxID=3691 RepID=UPI002B26E23B|nr:splicing factor U2af small subunit A-like [Populus nigra]